MFTDEEVKWYEKQLINIGITGKEEQKNILEFLYQLASIGYAFWEEKELKKN